MSIRVMTNVWEESKQENGLLLLLLALADHAADDGVCWPSIQRLADKVRRSPRHTKRLLSALVDSGELYSAQGIGRGNTSHYLVTVGFTEDEIAATLVRRFEIDPHEAMETATEIGSKRKGDTDDTIPKLEKVTSTSIKGDIQDEKVTSTSIKGDIAMSPESSEPSCNRHEPSDRAAKLPPSTPPPKSKSRKPKTPTPQAVNVFRANAHRYPPKAWYDDIAASVGIDQAALDRWGQVVKAWVGCGWNPVNVKGMLDFYRRNEIPPGNGPGGGNGRDPRGSAATPGNPGGARTVEEMQADAVKRAFAERAERERAERAGQARASTA